ncbi:MAG: GGDEF domain-containing protein, partial [Deltaproteobacteria bacterium]
ILPHTPLKGAALEAERLRQTIESHSYGGVVKETITMSLGVAAYPDANVKNSGDLINKADGALFKAKTDGKNLVRTADHD